MYFGWLDAPVDVDKDVQLPQFTLEDVILYDCSQNYTGGQSFVAFFQTFSSRKATRLELCCKPPFPDHVLCLVSHFSFAFVKDVIQFNLNPNPYCFVVHIHNFSCSLIAYLLP